jgi:uncharacterized protein
MTAPLIDRKMLFAFVGPFALFLLGFALLQGIGWMAGNSENLLLAKPAYWIFPLQTVVCAAALIVFWKNYEFGSARWIPLSVFVGLVAIVVWVSPQIIFGSPQRVEGFDPSVLAADPALYWTTIVFRFLRLVIVVPLIEEIFWRGFLQRYLIDERFHTVPFGKYTHLSFWGVVLGFMLVHNPPDYPAAVVVGALYGWLTVHTKSLLAPVIAHAVTNLALGIYIMKTGQWGFW